MKVKSMKRRVLEGRCQGYGPDYVPLIMAREAKSNGTAAMIPDPFEGRMIHTLSRTETMVYYTIRWDPDVVSIREQFLLDNDHIERVQAAMIYERARRRLEKSGGAADLDPEEADLVKKIRAGASEKELMAEIRKGIGSKGVYYSTDFLVDYRDGRQEAFSVKYDMSVFDPCSRKYRGRRKKFEQMVDRQLLERCYWESKGVRFHLVTRDQLDITYVKNIELVMRHYDHYRVVSREQKLLFLIAHRYLEVDMHSPIVPSVLLRSLTIDVDKAYDIAVQGEKMLEDRAGRTAIG